MFRSASARSFAAAYESLCRRACAAAAAPTGRQAQLILFAAGVLLLAGGLTEFADAAQQGLTTYNDSRIGNSVNAILTYLEGSFGALVMATAGIAAILSAAFGQYKMSLSLMVVAVGAFILRSLMSTFFNDVGVQANN